MTGAQPREIGPPGNVNGKPETGLRELGTAVHALTSERGLDHGEAAPAFVVARTRHQ